MMIRSCKSLSLSFRRTYLMLNPHHKGATVRTEFFSQNIYSWDRQDSTIALLLAIKTDLGLPKSVIAQPCQCPCKEESVAYTQVLPSFIGSSEHASRDNTQVIFTDQLLPSILLNFWYLFSLCLSVYFFLPKLMPVFVQCRYLSSLFSLSLSISKSFSQVFVQCRYLSSLFSLSLTISFYLVFVQSLCSIPRQSFLSLFFLIFFSTKVNASL